MPQASFGKDWFNSKAIPSTVTLKQGMRLNVTEATDFKQRRTDKEPRTNYRRVTQVRIQPDVRYHAIIYPEHVKVFVPQDGFFEEITLDLDLIATRTDRVGDDVNYRKWGNARSVIVDVLEVW